MANKKNKPHDVFFKGLLADLDRARTFFRRMLPEELSAVIDFETLEPENQSFVRRDLREFFSDALFKVKLLHSTDKYLIISILLEHKSYPDPGAAIQMLTYIAEGYRTQIERSHKHNDPDNNSSRGIKSLHPIIPFLYYHGKEDWKFIPLSQLFQAEYQPFLRYIPSFDTIYLNLRQLPEDDLLKLHETWLRAVLVTQQNSHDPAALIERFAMIFNTLSASLGWNFFPEFILYYVTISSIEIDQFKDLWEQLPDNENIENMNWLEKILWKGYKRGMKRGIRTGIERGYEEGIEKGIEKGINKGFRQQNLQIILKGIKHGFSIADLSMLTGLGEEDIQQIIAKENLDTP